MLLERLGTPRVGEVEAAGDIEVARGASFALHRAAEPDATAEQILAAQRIAERLIGDGGHFRGEMASLLRAVLDANSRPFDFSSGGCGRGAGSVTGAPFVVTQYRGGPLQFWACGSSATPADKMRDPRIGGDDPGPG